MTVTALRREMIALFEQVDQRFKQVDQRFEQVDQRFEQVDRRFDEQRVYMNVLIEQVRDDIRLLAETLAPLGPRVVTLEAAGELARTRLDDHDVRLRQVERRNRHRR